MNPEEYRAIQLAKWWEWADSQVEFWNKVAEGWPTYCEIDIKTQRRVIRCRECHEGIYFVDDPQLVEFQYSRAEILTVTVAHIRQIHGEEAATRPEMPLQNVQESRNESEV